MGEEKDNRIIEMVKEELKIIIGKDKYIELKNELEVYENKIVDNERG